jgi:hypothetical protein
MKDYREVIKDRAKIFDFNPTQDQLDFLNDKVNDNINDGLHERLALYHAYLCIKKHVNLTNRNRELSNT